MTRSDHARNLAEVNARMVAAGRCGDAMPSILPAELGGTLPPIVCALPAGHAGWHRDERGAEWGPNESPQFVGLTVDQEIRVEALHAAVAAGTYLGVDVATTEVLELAETFESYIRNGATSPEMP